VPTELELIHLLSHQIHHGKLPPPFDRIFHNLRILDYHPEEHYGISPTPSLPPPEPSPDLTFLSLSLSDVEPEGSAAPGDKN
jgi:hypothetical protein